MESETVTVRIKRGTPKGKFVAFLKEMAKEGDEIKFIKIPNAVTRRAMKDVDEGKVTRVKNIDELFSKIGI
jgi:ferredoxin-NADP reductase